MENNRQEILRVEHLKHYFTSGFGKNKIVVKAVDDISFNIYKGEVFSLVGESGCGKTTTGRALIKLYNATGGNVYFHDQRIISDYLNIKEAYKNGEATIEDLQAAKRDRKFENLVTPEMVEEAKKIDNNHPRVIELTNKYEQENVKYEKNIEELQAALEQAKATYASEKTDANKEKVAEVKEDLKRAKRELKLNKIRIGKVAKTERKKVLRQNRDLMRRMQMIFQDPIASLNPRMTVKEIVAEGLRINGVKDELDIDVRVKEALKIVGLVPEHAARYPHEFSGGQRQRIGIARALVANPSFIIADEPISALDVSIRAQVINLLNDLRENHGVTILFIAHDLSVVKYFSDRVAVMYFGKIVEMGKKELIFENTLHPYTVSLLDSIPLPDPLFESKRGDIMRYNPFTQHYYSQEQPTLKEVEPGHFVLCNTEEFNKYRAQIEKNKKK